MRDELFLGLGGEGDQGAAMHKQKSGSPKKKANATRSGPRIGTAHGNGAIITETFNIICLFPVTFQYLVPF